MKHSLPSRLQLVALLPGGGSDGIVQLKYGFGEFDDNAVPPFSLLLLLLLLSNDDIMYVLLISPFSFLLPVAVADAATDET